MAQEYIDFNNTLSDNPQLYSTLRDPTVSYVFSFKQFSFFIANVIGL